jgi:hypothetical protein
LPFLAFWRVLVFSSSTPEKDFSYPPAELGRTFTSMLEVASSTNCDTYMIFVLNCLTFFFAAHLPFESISPDLVLIPAKSRGSNSGLIVYVMQQHLMAKPCIALGPFTIGEGG